jgi:hypothetical protein
MRNHNPVIFISHASEDRELAELFRELLSNAFRSSFEVESMSQFLLGVDWRKGIDKSLDDTDIFLIIATGREKLSHTFTGYEVGYFRSSQQQRKFIVQEVERLVIPFALGTETPDPVSNIQGISIQLSDQFFLDTSSDSASTADNSGPIVKLLGRLHDIMIQLPGKNHSIDSRSAFERYQKEARVFYDSIMKLMSTLPASTEFPKTRLTIRLPAGVASQDFEISDRALVRCDGPTQAILQGEQVSRLVPWSDFAKRLGDDPIRSMWSDAIESLVRSSSTGSFVDSDQHVLSTDSTKVFSLFAAQSVTYHDKSRELSVFVMESLQPKDEGDPFTTFLGQAIGVALRYRSLFLETTSPYSPTRFQFCQPVQLKPKIKAMLRELRLLLKQSQEAHLGGEQYLARMYGYGEPNNTDTMGEYLHTRDTWVTQKAGLLDAATSALSETIDRGPLYEKFITVLKGFCEQTREMNKSYTTRVLKQLESELEAGE